MTAVPRIALLGCGRIGQVHARTLVANPDVCRLVAIADPVSPVAESLCAAFGAEGPHLDPDDVIARPDIDAVIIATPTDTHARLIARAASCGKDAFAEKPIALSLDDTDTALETVRQAGTRLQVGFQRRFDPGYATASERIRRGELGQLTMIRDAMRDPSPPPLAYLQHSGGLYRDMTIHNFDAVRWLMNEEPESLFAHGKALVSEDARACNDIDTSVVVLSFPSGAMATIENSRASGFGYDVRTEIFGTGGALIIGEQRDIPVDTFDKGGVHHDHPTSFIDRFRDGYRLEILGFIDALRTDRDVAVSGDDGRAALALALAAEESLAKAAPVSLASEVIHA